MMLDVISEKSKEKLELAKIGKKLYRRICNEYMSDPDDCPTIVVFPDGDDECNFYGLLYLDEALVRSLQKSALIVTSSEAVAKTAEMFTGKIKEIIKVSQEEIDGLISLYCLSPFEKILFISLSKPEGRTAYRLVGARGLTKEMLVAIGIYFLIPFQYNTERPAYEGDDMSIIKFLGCL